MASAPPTWVLVWPGWQRPPAPQVLYTTAPRPRVAADRLHRPRSARCTARAPPAAGYSSLIPGETPLAAWFSQAPPRLSRIPAVASRRMPAASSDGAAPAQPVALLVAPSSPV